VVGALFQVLVVLSRAARPSSKLRLCRFAGIGLLGFTSKPNSKPFSGEFASQEGIRLLVEGINDRAIFMPDLQGRINRTNGVLERDVSSNLTDQDFLPFFQLRTHSVGQLTGPL